MRDEPAVTARVLAKSGLVVLVLVLVVFATRGWWLSAIARSLVCSPTSASADAVLVENFDPSYLLFERTATLQRLRTTPVVVPVPASAADPSAANPIDKGIAELMARFARLEHVQIVPVRQHEPYALNAAYDIRDFLRREQLRSVVVVAPAFRSRRSVLVYGRVLGEAGIEIGCVPVFEGHTAENWTTSWHGVQVVTEQFVKLQYYRFYALRTAHAERPKP